MAPVEAPDNLSVSMWKFGLDVHCCSLITTPREGSEHSFVNVGFFSIAKKPASGHSSKLVIMRLWCQLPSLQQIIGSLGPTVTL